MDKILRQLQLTQLNILTDIDRFCAKYHLRYSLYAGSLLGAVRHQGFIPWDDDLDICMPREDYDRFIAVWQHDALAGYILQNKENSPDFTQSFTKIRKDHTAFVQQGEENVNYHVGIFVDVFPIDRMPNGKLNRMFFTFRCMKYQLFTREFIPPKGNFAEKAVSAVLLAVYPAKKRPEARKKLLKKITRQNNNKNCNCVGIEIMSTIRKPLPKDLFENLVRLDFETGKFSCVKDWDLYLTAKFGDYMTPPPESEREWKHHPVLIDFEHNYGEIKKGTDKSCKPNR